MKKLLAFALALAVMLFTVGPVRAQTPVENIFAELKQQLKEHKGGELLFLLKGAGEAFGLANARLRHKGIPQFYCQPDHLSLNAFNFVSMAIDEFERNRAFYINRPLLQETPHLSLATALLDGLQRTFPCK